MAGLLLYNTGLWILYNYKTRFIAVFYLLIADGLCEHPIAENDEMERAEPEWVYSPSDLMKLVKFEIGLFDGSKADFQNTSAGELLWWFEDYRESSQRMTAYIEDPIDSRRWTTIHSHPMLVLRLMKRFNFLNLLLQRIEVKNLTSLETDFVDKVRKFGSKSNLPNATDVQNVICEILDLQYMYSFNVGDLILGKFGDLVTNFGVSLEEAFEIGKYSFSIQRFPEALEWLQTVYVELAQSPENERSRLNQTDVLNQILAVSKKHDELIGRIHQNNSIDNNHRFTDKISANRPLETLMEQSHREFYETRNTSSIAAYAQLCAGKDYLTAKQQSSQYCWYEHKSDLAWTINPLKMEVYSWDPYVVQIHDVAGTRLLEALSQPTQYPELMESFDVRIGRIVQLVVSNAGDPYSLASEEIRVGAYSFGGEYTRHVDAIGGAMQDKRELYTVGDRVATFMVYLNNVYRGGYTVFLHLGVSVVPRKGSALFWYHLFRNGTIDQRTLHAGCPVILGQKWVANKWIRSNASFQKRKCTLNRLE